MIDYKVYVPRTEHHCKTFPVFSQQILKYICRVPKKILLNCHLQKKVIKDLFFGTYASFFIKILNVIIFFFLIIGTAP
jgi:hypothetical protein